MTVKWIAIAIGATVLCERAVATETTPAATGGTFVSPAATNEGPMVAPVKRMKPQMPVSPSKAVPPGTKAASETPARATKKPSATERR